MTERSKPEYKSAAELHAMSNAELADHIEANTWEWDWTTPSVREATVRLLRAANGELARPAEKEG